MKAIGTILALLMLTDTAYAISPMDNGMIKEAQHYGKIQMHRQLNEFLRPWISYEEKADRLDETAEHAYLYTPFLLIATDAREKSLNGRTIKFADGETILHNYAGTLSFSVVLFGNEVNFGQKAKILLKQNEKFIKAYEVIIPLKAEKIGSSNKSNFRLQCYFYFWEKNIICDKPIILSIVTSDKKEHQFYFSATHIK